MLSGAKITGDNPKNNRVENDYYATNTKAVTMLLNKYDFHANTILEPCVGSGCHCMVAKENNRRFIGCELDDKYFEVAKSRFC